MERANCNCRPTLRFDSVHVAALYAELGDERADDLFRKLKANGVKIVPGNSVVGAPHAEAGQHLTLADSIVFINAGRIRGIEKMDKRVSS